MALVTYLDGARKLLNQYVITATDGAGAQTLTIDVSALAKNNGKECTHLSLNKVYFNVQVTDNADAVEILRVFIPSPPVPHVSIELSTFTRLDFSLNT